MQEGFKKSDIEILVSTMNRNSLDFLKPMFPSHFSDYSILVVNQTNQDNLLQSDYPNVRVINSFEKGLSKSRNLALENTKGKLCVIADDDIKYNDDFQEKILRVFNENPDTAIAGFRVVNPEGTVFKKYPKARLINPDILQLLSIMSVEMVLNKTVMHDEAKFDERFGLGAQFTMGEEGVFVFSLKNQGFKIIMEPEVLLQHPKEHTNLKISVFEKYYIQGAFIYKIFPRNYFKWLFVKIFFDLKQGKIKFGDIKTALKAAAEGKKDLNQL
ncbi:glycosyltransferase family 2 protein [Flavobacterium beibuense]|uniref:Glycosyl transferase n=1 Tax=Flavobacterium beibuense TaxID=657326 RepID=A0A444W7Y2_9FLAO|nr:glycosyltransferase [Flavobacterium beibuense]RYJ41862.1 Glycosyl transferase [Flavobacterium beibuense]